MFKDSNDLINILYQQTGATAAVWIGYWDEPEEGKWVNAITGNPMGISPDTFSDWNEVGEPNGGTIENCATMQHEKDGRWNDMPCLFELCSVCELETYPLFNLRGTLLLM